MQGKVVLDAVEYDEFEKTILDGEFYAKQNVAMKKALLELGFSEYDFNTDAEAHHKLDDIYYPFHNHIVLLLSAGVTFDDMDAFITAKEKEAKK
jgi:phosphoribosylcarboxyaminoimidazole (NCAIR) mutase